MLIDWFTVAAQIVNFLVLVALLKRFLYGRIITAMDQREEKIASQLEEAAKKRKEAEREAETYRRTNRELDEKKEEMLFQVKEEVELKRKELMKRAHGKVDQIQARWHEAIQREKDAFLQDLRQRTGKQVYTIARRALTDLANAHLEQRMVEAFVERIAKLDEKKQKAILASTQRGDHGVVINSAFEIPTNARQKITKVVRNHIGDAIDIRYQISPDMILGIELKTHGHKIAWSIDDYLDSLEESVSEALSGEMEDRSIGRRADEKVQLKHPRKPKQKRGKR
ncbi:MAG: F0F1 ATP synthase subunit B [Thermodesulfobacteriota bacterium]